LRQLLPAGGPDVVPVGRFLRALAPRVGRDPSPSRGPLGARRGIGRALTQVCIERSVAKCVPAIGLHTTKEMAVAQSMYERMGFERAPEYDFRPGPTILVEAYRLMLT
jgi:hypothetical protein